jgi:hypothetical protein
VSKCAKHIERAVALLWQASTEIERPDSNEVAFRRDGSRISPSFFLVTTELQGPAAILKTDDFVILVVRLVFGCTVLVWERK